MKLLYLLPSVPDPPDAGARIRNLGLLRLAGAEHQVDAVAFGAPGDVERLRPLVRRAAVVPPPRRSFVRRIHSLATSPLPDMAHRLWSTLFLKQVHTMLASERYDAVQAEGIEMARYLRCVVDDSATARVYDAHNAELLLQRRAAAAAAKRRDWAAAVYSLVQWRRLERFEAATVRACRLVTAVSYHDANVLEALDPGRASVWVVPNGIEVGRYPFREPRSDDPPNLLFLGALGFRANAEAVQWLADHVLPGLHERVPDARLFVVGKAPPLRLVRIGQQDARVAVTGAVPDERPYLARASALVLPLQFGGGSRLKALVGMASGLPIVSTRAGMEGLGAAPGESYVRAESPREWIDALASLLGDAGRRRELARRGRALVEQRYDWQCIAPALHSAYASLMGLGHG